MNNNNNLKQTICTQKNLVVRFIFTTYQIIKYYLKRFYLSTLLTFGFLLCSYIFFFYYTEFQNTDLPENIKFQIADLLNKTGFNNINDIQINNLITSISKSLTVIFSLVITLYIFTYREQKGISPSATYKNDKNTVVLRFMTFLIYTMAYSFTLSINFSNKLETLKLTTDVKKITLSVSNQMYPLILIWGVLILISLILVLITLKSFFNGMNISYMLNKSIITAKKDIKSILRLIRIPKSNKVLHQKYNHLHFNIESIYQSLKYTAENNMNKEFGEKIDDLEKVLSILNSSYSKYEIDNVSSYLLNQEKNISIGTNANTQASTEPNTQASAVPNTQASTVPYTQASTVPNTQASTVPNTQASAVPNTQASTEPNTQASTEPNTQASTVPNTQASAVPNTQASTEPNTQASTEPNTQASTEPNTQASTEPNTQASTEPNTQASTEPNTQASTEPNTQASTEPNTQASTEPNTQASTEPNTQASTDIEEDVVKSKYLDLHSTILRNTLSLINYLYTNKHYNKGKRVIEMYFSLYSKNAEPILRRHFVESLDELLNSTDLDNRQQINCLLKGLITLLEDDTFIIYKKLIMQLIIQENVKLLTSVVYALKTHILDQDYNGSKPLSESEPVTSGVNSLEVLLRSLSEAASNISPGAAISIQLPDLHSNRKKHLEGNVIIILLQCLLKSIEISHYGCTGFLIKCIVTNFNTSELNKGIKSLETNPTAFTSFYEGQVDANIPGLNSETYNYCLKKLYILLYAQQKFAVKNKLWFIKPETSHTPNKDLIEVQDLVKDCKYLNYIFGKIYAANSKYGLLFLQDKDFMNKIMLDFGVEESEIPKIIS